VRLGRLHAEARDVGLDVERLAAHRQHPAPQSEQCTHLVEGGHRVAEEVHETGQQEVAHRVPGERAGAAESVLHEIRPPVRGTVLRREGGECHPQIAGR
jgi:hypothetical protein